MHAMTQLNGSDFEAVDESQLMVDPNSAEVNTGSTPPVTSTVPTGWVSIVSRSSGKCLDMTGGLLAVFAGDAAQQWTCLNGANQTFQLTAVSGGYKVTVKLSGMQLDMRGGPSATGDGVLLQQWPYGGGSNEIFDVEPTTNSYFTMKPVNSGLCLAVSGNSPGNGAAIEQNACNAGTNQQWEFVTAQ
jgi:glucosylceramidase